MTVPQILKEVGRVKPISRFTLYKYLRVCEIKPVSDLRQCPQQYPADTANRIVIRLGFAPATPATSAKPSRARKIATKKGIDR